MSALTHLSVGAWQVARESQRSFGSTHTQSFVWTRNRDSNYILFNLIFYSLTLI